MSYKIEIRPLATLDILEAYDWYEQQLSSLGVEFLDALDSFYAMLKQNPHVHSYYDKPVRQGKMNRFPYVVVYEVFDDTIVIYSVFMTRQDPVHKRGQ